jgi:hypothetical protein
MHAEMHGTAVRLYRSTANPADSKLAISFKKATADSIIGKAIAQPVPSPNRKSSCNRDRTLDNLLFFGVLALMNGKKIAFL